jgi:hypothetical protein
MIKISTLPLKSGFHNGIQPQIELKIIYADLADDDKHSNYLESISLACEFIRLISERNHYYQNPRCQPHPYPYPYQFLIEIYLPKNISVKEASRIGQFIISSQKLVTTWELVSPEKPSN